jgi:uncharacterized protein (TIGR02246 family)
MLADLTRIINYRVDGRPAAPYRGDMAERTEPSPPLVEGDQAAIGALLARYAEAYDQRRPADFAAVFTADGTLELPDGRTITGRADLTAFAAAAAARRPHTHHFVGVPRTEVDGDRARSGTHVVAVSRLGDSVRLLVLGRYEDRLVRLPEGWRIARRRIVALTDADLPP